MTARERASETLQLLRRLEYAREADAASLRTSLKATLPELRRLTEEQVEVEERRYGLLRDVLGEEET